MNANIDCLSCFQVEKEDGFQSMKPGQDFPTDPTSNPTCVTSCSHNGDRTNPSFALCIDAQSKTTKDLQEICL